MSQPGQRRVALVIGNAAYGHGPALENPQNDALAIAAAFERLGFAPVKVLCDLKLAEMRRALADFGQAAEGADIAALYFAGHGMEVNGENFLLPVDAELGHARRVRAEAASLNELLAELDGARTLRLVILDCCRDNPYRTRMRGLEATRSMGRGLASFEPGADTLIAYSAKHGTLARDGEPGGNSPFAKALLAHLERPGLEIGLLFRYVRNAVLTATGGAQEPYHYGSLGSKHIYLAGGEELATAEQVWRELDLASGRDRRQLVAFVDQFDGRAPIFTAMARKRLGDVDGQDGADWERTRQASSIAAFERYLQDWPSGLHGEEAKARLDALADDEAWQAAIAGDSEGAVRDYLALRPAGRHAGEAQSRLRAAEAAESLRREEAEWRQAAGGNALGALQAIAQRTPASRFQAAAQAAIASHPEEIAWVAAGQRGDAGALAQFLAAHPGGHYAARAAAQLASIEETAAWARISASQDAAAIRAFLAQFPSGAFAGPAKAKLRALTFAGKRVLVWGIAAVAAAAGVWWMVFSDPTPKPRPTPGPTPGPSTVVPGPSPIIDTCRGVTQLSCMGMIECSWNTISKSCQRDPMKRWLQPQPATCIGLRETDCRAKPNCLWTSLIGTGACLTKP